MVQTPLNILMASYLFLVTLDSATTYIGIKHFSLVETWRSQVLFDYYGLTLGIIVSTAFCFCVGWLLWKVRGFKKAAYLGLSVLALTELAAVVNNLSLILSSEASRSLGR